MIYNPQCRDCTFLRHTEQRDEYYAQKPHLKPRPKPKPETPEAWEDVDVKKEETEEVVDLTLND